jgi:glyoxylase-like metal-dependent hydrolase (beta-lactamase superfamily II)
MRAIAVHEDVVVAIGAIWKTTCTAVRSGDEAFLVDSPILPEELEALPALLDQAGFAISGLLVTHADWDHLLGRYAFPDASIGCGETTAARLTAEPGAAQRELRDFDEQYLIDRPGPLSLPGVQALPVPGYCSLGDRELELYPADGHTSDGTAIWIPWARVLVCGDYLSPGAIPELFARRLPGDAAAAGAARRAGRHGRPRPRRAARQCPRRRDSARGSRVRRSAPARRCLRAAATRAPRRRQPQAA